MLARRLQRLTPQFQLEWKTPSEYAFTCNPRRDLALRYAEGSAPAPVATTAQPGKSKAESKTRSKHLVGTE
jgi:putative transposase